MKFEIGKEYKTVRKMEKLESEHLRSKKYQEKTML